MPNLKQCATHGAETANCGPLCSPMMEAPAPRRRRIIEVKTAAVNGLQKRETEQERSIIDGGQDDDPATPE